MTLTERNHSSILAISVHSLFDILLQHIAHIVTNRESFTACLDFRRPIGTFEHRLGKVEKQDIAAVRTHETAHYRQVLLQPADP